MPNTGINKQSSRLLRLLTKPITKGVGKVFSRTAKTTTPIDVNYDNPLLRKPLSPFIERNADELSNYSTPVGFKVPVRYSRSGRSYYQPQSRSNQSAGEAPYIHVNRREGVGNTLTHERRHAYQFQEDRIPKLYGETRQVARQMAREMRRSGVRIADDVSWDGTPIGETPLSDLPLEAHAAFFRAPGETRRQTYNLFRSDAEDGLRALESLAGTVRPIGLRPSAQFLRSRQGRAMGAFAQVSGHDFPIRATNVDKLRNYLQAIYDDPNKMRRSVRGTLADIHRRYPNAAIATAGLGPIGLDLLVGSLSE